jgi:hypothetical protein
MRLKQSSYFLLLLLLAGWAPQDRVNGFAPAPAPDACSRPAVYPIALAYRQQLEECIESLPLAPVGFSPYAPQAPPAISQDSEEGCDREPAGGDRLYALMSLQL